MVKQISQPMVAFGAPVRNWNKQQYGVTLKVLGLAEISPIEGVKVPVLGSNHPSYIWYVVNPATYHGDEAKADAAGLKVMGQDLSAACWQAGMGSKPETDPVAQLESCKQIWQVNRKAKTCELFYVSIRNLTVEKAQAKCLTRLIVSQLNRLKENALAAS